MIGIAVLGETTEIDWTELEEEWAEANDEAYWDASIAEAEIARDWA